MVAVGAYGVAHPGELVLNDKATMQADAVMPALTESKVNHENEHIIWDFDGTLFDTYPAMAAAFHYALSEYGISWNRKPQSSPIWELFPLDAKQHYKKLYSLEDSFFSGMRFCKKYYEFENAKPFDGVAEICRNICNTGGKNYLFTHRGESAQ